MITPDDLLEVAERILPTNPGDEGSVRASISRSYYAAYHSCRAFHDGLPLPGRLAEKPGGDHENLIQRLERPDDRVVGELQNISKKAGNKLRAFRDLRLVADYKLQMDVTLETAKKALLQGRDLVNLSRSGTQLRASLGNRARSS